MDLNGTEPDTPIGRHESLQPVGRVRDFDMGRVVGPRRRRVDRSGSLHAQGFVGALPIEGVAPLVEQRLGLLYSIGRLDLQLGTDVTMNALVDAILFGVPRVDAVQNESPGRPTRPTGN
jgi:hypothetical protein